MGKLKTYHQNDVIFCQGDESKSMFIVRKGRVGVILDRGSDHENFLAELLSGQFLGEMGMLDSQRPSSLGGRTENRRQQAENQNYQPRGCPFIPTRRMKLFSGIAIPVNPEVKHESMSFE